MMRFFPVLFLIAALAGAAVADSTEKASALPPEFQPIPFDSVTAARYRMTAGHLAAAVATNDAKAFRALHTDAGWAQADDWWKAMYADQKKRQGQVVQVIGPLRGSVRFGNRGIGIPRDGAAILVKFEKQLGASMSFVLDGSGRIEKSNSWLEHELKDATPQDAEVLWPTKQPATGK